MRWDRPSLHETVLSLPGWVIGRVEYDQVYATDEDRMRLAIALAAENIANGSGGPFGAAVFERESGRLIAVGVNSVVRLNNSTAHAEMIALQLAERRIASYSLAADGHPAHELFTSCAPCAMCLGAVLWSGVTRLVSAAQREDAERIAFDEGPVFAESYTYLRARGIEITDGLLRNEARAVLEEYRVRGGAIYNG
jgi:tRNA(Arg) A34 adenosine deaminase TadA